MDLWYRWILVAHQHSTLIVQSSKHPFHWYCNWPHVLKSKIFICLIHRFLSTRLIRLYLDCGNVQAVVVFLTLFVSQWEIISLQRIPIVRRTSTANPVIRYEFWTVYVPHSLWMYQLLKPPNVSSHQSTVASHSRLSSVQSDTLYFFPIWFVTAPVPKILTFYPAALRYVSLVAEFSNQVSNMDTRTIVRKLEWNWFRGRMCIVHTCLVSSWCV